MNQNPQFSEDFITAWANVLAAVHSGELESSLALERINYLIRSSQSADIRRFLKRMRWRIQAIAIKKAVNAWFK